MLYVPSPKSVITVGLLVVVIVLTTLSPFLISKVTPLITSFVSLSIFSIVKLPVLFNIV